MCALSTYVILNGLWTLYGPYTNFLTSLRHPATKTKSKMQTDIQNQKRDLVDLLFVVSNTKSINKLRKICYDETKNICFF